MKTSCKRHLARFPVLYESRVILDSQWTQETTLQTLGRTVYCFKVNCKKYKAYEWSIVKVLI